uniref:Uncharacterized protein n=1 Tax=Arundo donax TaxID=35708 RepID=A0A0A8ZXB8_ARUDO
MDRRAAAPRRWPRAAPSRRTSFSTASGWTGS